MPLTTKRSLLDATRNTLLGEKPLTSSHTFFLLRNKRPGREASRLAERVTNVSSLTGRLLVIVVESLRHSQGFSAMTEKLVQFLISHWVRLELQQ